MAKKPTKKETVALHTLSKEDVNPTKPTKEDVKPTKPTKEKESKLITVQFKKLSNETYTTYYGTFKIDSNGIAKDIDKKNIAVFDKLKIKYSIIG